MRDLASMTLVELSAEVKCGVITLDLVAAEYARRVSTGVDPDTGRTAAPVRVSPAFIAAVVCPSCHSLVRAPETSK